MAQSPWDVTPREQKLYFGTSEITRTEKPTSNGGNYFEMQVVITPLELDQKIVDNTYRSFQPEWGKIVIPAVMQLVKSGKIKQATDMENKQFIAYRWREHRSYDARDVKYWQDKDAAKLDVDEQGRSYKRRMTVEFVDVFPTEAEWRAAYEASKQDDCTPPATNPMMEAARAALPSIIMACGTDMTTLQKRLTYEPLSSLGDIQAPEIKNEVAKYVCKTCGSDTYQQQQMLDEINSHFNGDTPYLLIDSPEIMANLSEVAF